jgi:hypothetical protein
LASLDEMAMLANQDRLDQQGQKAELAIQDKLDKMVSQDYQEVQVPLGLLANVVKLDQLDNQD